MNSPHRYSAAEIQALWRAMRERRDMRHFLPEPLPQGMIAHLVEAAHLGPSVGYMQPWRFIRISEHALRQSIREFVEAARFVTADALPTRNDEFLSAKIEGIMECAELLVVVLMPERERHIIGRRTIPEMDLASVGCAIQNMWLTARVEGIGLGWVSFFEPEALSALLDLPEGAQPVAILCIGYVDAFYPRPLFEDTGWGSRLAITDVLFENRWPESAGGTLPKY